MSKISIIVPIYQTEKYINFCLDSILAQTFTDWECILVDDGSYDKSGAICDKYAINDPRFRVIHKKNEGVSSARNAALEVAKSPWITFADSDDVLHPDTFSTCIEIVENNHLDFLQFSYTKRISEFGDKNGNKTNVLNKNEIFKYRNFSGNVWQVIFNSEIIKSNNLRFDPKMKLGEDQLFVYEFMQYANRFKIIDNILYYYRDNPDGAMHNEKTNDMLYLCYKFTYFKHKYPNMYFKIDETVLTYIERLILRGENNHLSDVLEQLKPSDFHNRPWCTNVMVAISRINPVAAIYFEAAILPIYIKLRSIGAYIKHSVFKCNHLY